MAKSLNDLLNCCVKLGSDKLTERKQSASKLELLLKDNEIICALDERSSRKSRSRDDVNWNYVVDQIGRFIEIEIDNVKGDQLSASCKKKHKELGQLYQCVIGKAENRGPNLKSSSVFSHILNVFFKVDRNSTLIDIYTNILLKYLLVKRKHTSELGVKKWHEFVSFYLGLLNAKDKNKGSQIPVARCVKQLFSLSHILPYVRNDEILSNFDEIFKNIRQEKNHVFLELIISSVTSFCWANLSNSRVQICDLGEGIFNLCLQLWKYKITSIKTELVNFFQLQIIAHFLNPSDHSEIISTYPWNSEKWKSCLQEMFQLIFTEFLQLNEKIQMSSDKSIFQQRIMIEFIASVLHQIFSYKLDQMDLTFSCSISSTMNKKTKISIPSIWESLVNGLKNVFEPKACIIWMDVVKTLYSTPHLLLKNSSQFTEIFNTLASIISDPTREDVTKHALQTLHTILDYIASHSELISDLQGVINSLWTSSLKFFDIIEDKDGIIQLLAKCWQTGVVSSNFEIYKMFNKQFFPRTNTSMNLLLNILKSSSFPTSQVPQGTHNQEKNLDDSHPVRRQILEWLLPSDVSVVSKKNTEKTEKDEVELVCTLMLSMVLVSPSNLVYMNIKHKLVMYDKAKCIFLPKVIHQEYITSMQGQIAPIFLKSEKSDKNTFEQNFNILNEMEVFLMEKIKYWAMGALDPGEKKLEFYMKDVIELYVFTTILFQKVQVFPNIQFLVNLLRTISEKSVSKFITLLEELLASENDQSVKLKIIVNSIKNIENLVLTSTTDLTNVIPDALVELLLQIIDGGFVTSISMTQSRVYDQMDSTAAFDDSFEELDCDKTLISKPCNKGSKNPLDVDDLNEVEKIQVLAFKITLKLLFMNRNKFELQRRNLFQLFLEDGKENNVKLQMLVMVNLIGKEHDFELSSNELSIIVNCARVFLSVYRFDMAICAEILNGFVYYIELLKNAKDKEMNTETKMMVLKVIEIFWSLRNDKYSPLVRIKLADTLIAISSTYPDDDWKLNVSDRKNGNCLVFSSELLIQMLCDTDVLVRCHLANHIDSICTKGSKMFNLICTTLDNLINCEIHYNSKDDEFFAHEATVLLVSKNLISSVSNLQRKSLWLIFQFAKQQIAKQEHVFEVLKNVSSAIGYDSLSEFMSPRIMYIILTFIMKGFSIDLFPSQCLGLTMTEFLTKYHTFIVSCFVLRNEFQAIEDMGELLGFNYDLNRLLIDSFVLTIVATLPIYSKYLDDNKVDDKTSLILEGLQQYKDKIGDHVYNMELENHFDTIVLQLILRLHDPSTDGLKTSRFTADMEVSSFYPTFTSSQILISLSQLAVGFGKETTISSFLKFPESIPNILSKLALHVTASIRTSERLSPIRSYYFFSMLLLDSLHDLEKYGGHFVVREIIYRVLYFIEKNDDEKDENCVRIVMICFEILDALCEKINSHIYISQEFSKHLCFITSKLIHLSGKKCFDRPALRILKCLITNSSQNEDYLEYIDAVAQLDEFPPDTKFAQLNDSLVAIKRNRFANNTGKELKRVCNNLKRLKLDVSDSVLKNLKGILKKKGDSNVLGDDIKEIVASLIRICWKGDSKLTNIAIDCLGLIGPIPISGLESSMHLQSSELPQHLFSTYPLKFNVVVEALLDLCIHECSLISGTAWNCLVQLFNWDKKTKDQLLSFKSRPFFTYIEPYLIRRKKIKDVNNNNINSNTSFDKLADDILFDKESGFDSSTTHVKWLQNLVSVLLTTAPVNINTFILLEPLCSIQVDFARLVFVFIVHNMIISYDDNKKMMSLACQTWVDLFLNASEETRKQNDMKKKIGEVINLITGLRSLDASYNTISGHSGTCWNNNFWLDINYLQLSQAALLCGQYYNAAMFIEIWSDPLRTNQERKLLEVKNEQFTSGSLACATAEEQTLLYNIYSNIGDIDVVHGVNTNTSMLSHKRLQLLQSEKEYHKALLSSDLQCSTANCSSDVLETLMKSELYHTALMYLRSVADEEVEKYSEIQFEAAWRNGFWNPSQLRCSLSSKFGYHRNVYQSFISLESQEEELFMEHIMNAKHSIIKSIQSESNSTKFLHNVLSRCFTLNLLETAGKCAMKKNIDDVKYPSVLLNDFSYYEPSLSAVSQVIKILHVHSIKSQRNDIKRKTVEHIINHSKIARASQRYEIAEKFISVLSNQNDVDLSVTFQWKLEEAMVYWERKETNLAMNGLRELISEMKLEKDDQATKNMYPAVLSLYGHWLGETKSQNPVHIMENYLEPAIQMMEEESLSNSTSTIDAYHSLAKYADTQYQSLRDYVKSTMFETKQMVIQRNKNELNTYNTEGKKKNTDRMVEMHFRMLEKQCMEDEMELEQTMQDQNTFLEKAMQNYCKCLEHGEKYDLKVLRLCSLWFEHHSEEAVNNLTKNSFEKIKSNKFLPVMYQLAARLGTKMTTQCSMFKEILEAIIEKCCIDHPHHSIFILLALCNADFEEKLMDKQKKRKSTTKGPIKSNDVDGDKSRINAAKSVLSRVRSLKGHLVQDAEKLASAYIDLAYWDISHLKTEKGSFMIADQRLVRKISSLSSVAIPTVEIEIDPTCEYDNVTHIVKFDTSFSHAGGVNLPKIITCIGSDGLRRKQLIKGRDDLRQDAVMQQVFGVVNLLLKADPETRHRDLRMRTYKIVPLSRKSGLMEWCEGTMPLGNYLQGGRDGTVSAHTRYYPKDWTIKECRSRLSNATSSEGRKSKYTVFLDIQEHFHPVFRHFFYEKFRDPSEWFSKRLCYTRSTAVCSIVGYIVGLGDRHCQNILIDCNTAEVVHIDLGVAFEKGKLLPTPETIPFRLTRDVIDGMGINGIEGVFRRCCEKTMNVMRSSSEGILTIVEVLLYDPLSDWTITSEKLRKLQKDRDSNGDECMQGDYSGNNSFEIDTDRNKTAERVLLRLKQKLAGSEGGAFLGTQGHVNYLIQEAINPRNLCALFPGWQPWL